MVLKTCTAGSGEDLKSIDQHGGANITIGPDTWLGPFWVATREGLVIEVGFAGVPPPQYHTHDDMFGAEVASQIHEFLEQDRRRFTVSLDWTVLPPAHAAILRTLYESVPWGDFVTYGELAAMAGFPGAARAAGTACRVNPFSILVPAHRVIAAGGRIGGYGGRTDIKRKLLAREGLGPFKE